VHLGELAYEAALYAARPLLSAAAPLNGRLRRGVDGRRAALRSLRAWAAAARLDDRPLLWLHAPSVGEALMAAAILSAARERAPRLQSIFTFFSPSAERMAHRVGADWSGYLPWDLRGHVRAALDAVRPSTLAFVRTEIWPVLAREAQERGARVVLVNAVLAKGSSRAGRAARLILGPAYRRLAAIGAVSADDMARFGLLGVSPDRIRLTGDARFDQVWERVQHLDRDRPLLRSLASAPGRTLVAGSTWPPDEERLTAALALLRSEGRRWRLIIAPHEPTARHVTALERRLERAGIAHARLPPMDEAAPRDVAALVVDRIGVLADLYAVGDAAWVGGGFGRAGLHSVVEPAALGLPVLYGPRHGNAREAERLARAGGGFVVRDGTGLSGTLARLDDDPDAAHAAGHAAREFVRSQLGAARRNAELLTPT
jgi:3-deoxy-D-manno-octulosonic-acid transferase